MKENYGVDYVFSGNLPALGHRGSIGSGINYDQLGKKFLLNYGFNIIYYIDGQVLTAQMLIEIVQFVWIEQETASCVHAIIW